MVRGGTGGAAKHLYDSECLRLSCRGSLVRETLHSLGFNRPLTWFTKKTHSNPALNSLVWSTYLEIDIGRMFSQHSDQVGEALIDGNVKSSAHGVVQKVNIRPFAQQQSCNLCLIAKVI